MPEATFAVVAAIVFVAFMTQAATGFGGMVIALTLGALLCPVDRLLVWLVPQVVLLSVYLLIRHHAHVDWRLLLRIVLPAMGSGLLLGQLVFYRLDTEALRTALGVLVVLLALRELLRTDGAAPPRAVLLPWTFAAGIVHGIFATGGPLLVYALGAVRLDKGVFRSTLAVIWLLMAVALLSGYLASGRLGPGDWPRIALLSAVLIPAITAGEWLHGRIPATTFRRAINVLLLVCGLALVL